MFTFPESTGKKENNELCASKFFLQELLKSTSLVPDHRSGWRVAHRFCNSLGIMLASKSLTIGQELFPTYYYLWWEEIFWVFSKKVLIKKRLFEFATKSLLFCHKTSLWLWDRVGMPRVSRWVGQPWDTLFHSWGVITSFLSQLVILYCILN